MKKSMELLHGEKYPEAMKVAKKFVSKNALRPVLLFTQHRKDGAIIATDSHKAVIINDIHGFKEDYLVHPRTNEFAKGNYPEMNETLNTEDYKTSIKLNLDQVKVWLQVHKSINQLTKSVYGSNQHVTLKLEKDLSSEIDDKNGNKMTFNLPYMFYDNLGYNINYKPELMRDALEAHVAMEAENIEIKVNGKLRPIHLESENVKSVVMPARVY